MGPQLSWCCSVLASAVITACASPTSSPATQVIVAVTSDLAPATELVRVDVEVSTWDGSNVVAMKSYEIVRDNPQAGQQVLPITFSIGRARQDSFLLRVSGHSQPETEGAIGDIIEQRAIVVFQPGKALLLQVFLARVCRRVPCGVDASQTCYVTERDGVKAGECGAITVHDASDSQIVSLPELPDLSRPPVEVALAGAAGAGQPNDSGGSGASGMRAAGGSSAGEGAAGTEANPSNVPTATNTAQLAGAGAAGVGGNAGARPDAPVAGGEACDPKQPGCSMDPCMQNHGGCDVLVACSNIGGKAQCAPCPNGYTDENLNGTKCSDIDECAKDNGGCDLAHGTCTNTPGSSACSCKQGYVGDGFTCKLNEECNDTKPCNGLASCQLTDTKNVCVCKTGFEGNGMQCQDIDECRINNGACHVRRLCRNTDGGRVCENCGTGWINNGDTGCIEINPCDTNNGGCDSRRSCMFVNSVRSCGPCPSGYTNNGDTGCLQIDPCDTNNGGCDSHRTCTFSSGVRSCGNCASGWTNVGATGCQDTNECEAIPGPCEAQKRNCANRANGNGYECTGCKTGYMEPSTGSTCVPEVVNPCDTNNGGCDARRTCMWSGSGSRTCGNCSGGFSNDGATGCQSPCAVNNGGCDPRRTCLFNSPTRSCGDCPAGWANSGATACLDVNECVQGPTECDAQNRSCRNDPGSYQCAECKAGYMEWTSSACVPIGVPTGGSGSPGSGAGIDP